MLHANIMQNAAWVNCGAVANVRQPPTPRAGSCAPLRPAALRVHRHVRGAP